MSGLDDGSSPWENGDVPVRAEPLEFSWDAPTPPAPDGDDTPATRGRRWTVAAVAAVGVLLVAVIAWPGGDDPSDPETAPVTFDSLPSVSDPDDPSDEGDDERADRAADGPAVSDRVDAETISTPAGTLPPGVAAITEPTEIVVQSFDGVIHTLSLPSGTVRSVDLGLDESFGGNLVVTSDAAMVSSYGQGTFVIPRDGVPVRIDDERFGADATPNGRAVSPYGYLVRPDGRPWFLVAAYETDGNRRTDHLVSSDGKITVLAGGVSSDFSEPVRAYGVRIVNDAGGVYRIDDDGAERISDGRAAGSSATELLIRECDDELSCGFSVVDFDGENRRDVDLPPSLGQTYGLELSPDASAVTFTSYSTRNEQVILEFEGDSMSSPIAGFGGSAWASDGSGVFSPAEQGGLVFLDRNTGEAEVFAEELGQLGAIDIRFPEAELDEVRAISDDVVAFQTSGADDIGLDIAVFADVGTMSILDLDRRTSTSWNAPRITGTNSPRIFELDDRIVVLAGTGNSGFSTVPGESTPIDDDVLPAPPFAVDPDGIGIWTGSSRAAASVELVVDPLRDLDTGDGPRTVSIPFGSVLGDDGAGSIVIESGGTVYVTDGTDLTPLTTGDLIAVSPNGAVVRECDDDLVCRVYLTDRENGERSQTVTLAASAVAADERREVSLVGSLSPDGGTTLVEVPRVDADGEPSSEWTFVDVSDDTRTPIGTPDDDQPVLWNDDGSYAAFLADERLMLYEASTRTVIEIDLPNSIRAIGRIDGDFVPT